MQGYDSNCDDCHICKEGGKLFCCDECPRAFHDKCLRSGRPTSTTWKCDLCTQDNHADIVSEEPSRSELQPLLTRYTNNGNNSKEIQTILKLYDIVTFLMNYDFGDEFKSPVDINSYPAYLDYVDEPMDLGTIAKNIRGGIYFDTVVTSTSLLENATLPELKNSTRSCDFDVGSVASASMNSEDLSVLFLPEQSTEGVPTAPKARSRQCELTPTLMKESVGIARKEPFTGPRTVFKRFRCIKIEATGKARPGQTIKDGNNLFYIAKENDRVSKIASNFNVSVENICKLNKRRYPLLEAKSKLKAKTMIKLPRTDELAVSNLFIEEKNDLVGLNRAIFLIIKDIELVWHNCFRFNEPNSRVYRMGMVQRKKFLVLVNSTLDLDYTVVEKIKEYTAGVQERNRLGDLNSAGRCIQAADTHDLTLTSYSKRHKSCRSELGPLPFPKCCISKKSKDEDGFACTSNLHSLLPDEKKSLGFSSTDQQSFDKAGMKTSTITSREGAKDVIDLTADDSNGKADKISTSQEVIDSTDDDIPRNVQFDCQPEHQEETSLQINECSTRNEEPKRSRLCEDGAEVDFMRSLRSDITERFLELGFAKYDKQWKPVIFLSPFDIPRSELREQSIAEYQAARSSKLLRHLVYWYGENIISLVSETDTVSDLEGIRKEYNRYPIDLYRKSRERKELKPEEQRRLNGLESFSKALRTPKQERWNRILNESNF